MGYKALGVHFRGILDPPHSVFLEGGVVSRTELLSLSFSVYVCVCVRANVCEWELLLERN